MKILVDGMSKDKGGIGSLLLNFAIYNKQLPEEQAVCFEFLLPENSDYQEPLRKLGYKYYTVSPITKVFAYQQIIRQIFSKHQYDFLWLNNTSKVNCILPLCAAKAGAKLITHPHGVSDEETGLKKVFFRVLNSLNLPIYKRLMRVPMACSQEAARCYYWDETIVRKTTVIKNGIFVDRFAFSQETRKKVRLALGIQEDEIVIGTVGRLTAVKNYPFLISLLSSLPPNYRCVILGEGEERENLSQLAAQRGVENRLLLAGLVENVQEYLCAFDLFVMPSLHEGLPYAAIEAQASGLPCIVSDTVSEEVALTDLVFFEALNQENPWRARILSIACDPSRRNLYSQKIRESGYSIEKSFEEFMVGVKNAL